ncbi:MAG: hypothetical protein KIS88_08650 [Anaerolineales bacterium]|nr:hypothetical protein [Anaerolineales bacterium]
MSHSAQPSARLELSQQVFAYLLWLYPRKFRQAYGPHMAQLFKDCSREAASQGSTALLEMWIATLLDIFKTALEERIKEVWNMNREQTQRRASLLLLAGAAVMLLVIASGRLELTYDDPLGGPDGWIEYTRLIGLPLSYLLMAASAWLLSNTHKAARLVLGISALGALVAVVTAVLRETNLAPIWWLNTAGYLAFLAGMGIFGLGLRNQRPGTAAVVAISGFLLPVVALIALGFYRYWWSRGGATTGFTIQAGLDMINTSQLIAPVLLCIAAILLMRTHSPARTSQ